MISLFLIAIVIVD